MAGPHWSWLSESSMAFCQTLVARSKKNDRLDYSNSLDIVLYQQALERLTLSDLSNHLRSYLIAIYHQPIPPTQPGHVGREARLGQVEGQMRCNYFEPRGQGGQAINQRGFVFDTPVPNRR